MPPKLRASRITPASDTATAPATSRRRLITACRRRLIAACRRGAHARRLLAGATSPSVRQPAKALFSRRLESSHAGLAGTSPAVVRIRPGRAREGLTAWYARVRVWRSVERRLEGRRGAHRPGNGVTTEGGDVARTRGRGVLEGTRAGGIERAAARPHCSRRSLRCWRSPRSRRARSRRRPSSRR